ncbi:MAG: hypothetical protein RI963_3053, partial [Planctomycetota bacterium]
VLAVPHRDPVMDFFDRAQIEWRQFLRQHRS